MRACRVAHKNIAWYSEKRLPELGKRKVESCPFCDRTMFTERIVAETDTFFVIATLGQITDGGYVLIFPKRHAKCSTVFSDEEMLDLTLLILDCEKKIFSEYGVFPVLFEHGIVGQTVPHAHIHLVPTTIDLFGRITTDFPDAKRELFDIIVEGIPRNAGNFHVSCNEMSDNPPPYLLWRPSRSGANTVANMWWKPRTVPAQYLRIILAEALGRPERANWRTMDLVLDARLRTETVLRLKKHFN